MARRKRLTPASSDYLSAPQPAAPEAGTPAGAMGLPANPAPIAQVAGDASAAAALGELAAEIRAARAEGRLVQRLPLDQVEIGYLVRDRLLAGDEDMHDLKASIRDRGQQTPIEVVEMEDGRFGLISGWRRLRALGQLHAETGEDRFATVLALLRRPEGAADAYRAMVEENEIRVGLSYYERARIAAKAADAGVHPDRRTAVRALFAAASRAKRSKIASFLALHDALDDRLRFPAAIPERLELALSRALEADPSLREKLRERLRKAACDTADAELALLVRAVKGGGEPKGNLSLKGRSETNTAPIDTLARPEDAEEPRRGVWLQSEGGFLRQRLTLSGPRVDAAFRARLVAWLREEGGQS